ncbi:hypothetical protein FDECE_7090 [Fusarium decemcellulare]|nr:hypothetical protein FDECE_7090 [Fusarium decemcellulare]
MAGPRSRGQVSRTSIRCKLTRHKGRHRIKPQQQLENIPLAPNRPRQIPISPGSTTTESRPPTDSTAQTSRPLCPSSQDDSRTNVFHGFDPHQNITPALAHSSSDAIPQPTSPPAAKPAQAGKPPTFALDGSCSSSEQDLSLGSGEDGSLESATASLPPGSPPSPRKEQASFSSDVIIPNMPGDEAAVDSDTDYIDESAIDDDDDSSDWEDEIDDSGKSSMDDKFFQRIDFKSSSTSLGSLITLMLAQNERARTLGNHASQSTSAIPQSRAAHSRSLGASPNDSDEAPLMMKDMHGPGLKPIHEVPRSSAQPIMVGPSHVQAQVALSPRTTRRNMLATELTESLRRHLLWERQQKSSTANAVLKRRHTSHDVANLKQYPEKPCMKKSEDINASSWNQYFSKEASDGYHSKGW